MQKYLIRNIQVVNEGTSKTADVLIANGRIERIASNITENSGVEEIRGDGKHLFPGCIDDQVHFREPGLTHKATIFTEAKAAIAGGVTSFMEMPNTQPNALTQELLEDKYHIASKNSLANYSFYMGTSNDNADEVLKTNNKKKNICGIKIFLGSSTGHMLVDNPNQLDRIFRESELLIATHCEDEAIIKRNLIALKATGKELTAADHPVIRTAEACYASSLHAIQIAKKYDTRLHILHISTALELQLFSNMLPLKDKRITAEACVHHLHFTSQDYERLGNLIKCNPAIKAPENKEALWGALLDDRLDVISKELDSITSRLLAYQQANDIIDPEMQSANYFSRFNDANRALNDQRLQLQIAEDIEAYLRNSTNNYSTTPSPLSIQDPTLNTLIAAYNVAQMDRKRLVDGNVPVGNIKVQQLDEQIEKLRQKILENLQNIKAAYRSNISNLQQESGEAQTLIRSLPVKQQNLTEIKRQQESKLAVYNFLLEKREESAISLAEVIGGFHRRMARAAG